MRGIAFYGKGGIGKSTTLSNVTAALSTKNKKILQIGCDPKHDSTRLLLGGFTQLTVLDQLRTNGSVSLESVILTGYNGISCIESGGPEPGVGCAGRGVIQMLDLLNNQGLDTAQYDYVFFDVLGDVVCGGFAVPMRKGYADEVYIVTSGEIASLYAANNIVKAIKRFSAPYGKLGGIIGNGRETRNEREVIAAFTKKIGSQLVAFIPRSELIAQAELESEPIIQYAPDSEIASIYRSIAEYIESNQTPVIPQPLSDDELEHFFSQYCYKPNKKKQEIYGNKSKNDSTIQITTPKISKPNDATECSKNAFNQNSSKKKPAHGCSLAGAISVVRQIKDTISVVHSPSGCSYIHFWSHMIGDLQLPYGHLTLPNLVCTNMQETDVIYGGSKNLKDTVLKVHKKFPSYTLFLVTSCPSGIIGEDITSIVEQLKLQGVDVFPISSDGIITGDYTAGIFNAYKAIAENFVDKSVTPIENTVNVIGEITIAKLGEPDFDKISSILHSLGININCRFIRNTTLNQIKQFKLAKTNLLFTDEPTLSHKLVKYFKNHYGIDTLKLPIPAGFDRTEEFLHTLSLNFDKVHEFKELITSAKIEYEYQLSFLRNYFSGKKALIFCYSQNIDWLLSTLIDLGVRISKVCVSTTSSNDAVLTSKFERKIQIENNFPLRHVNKLSLKNTQILF